MNYRWLFGNFPDPQYGLDPRRRAMRERGYDVCVSCGYRLVGLDDDISRCPECGASRAARGDPKQARS